MAKHKKSLKDLAKAAVKKSGKSTHKMPDGSIMAGKKHSKY